jgi:hypothetical protein
MVITYPFDDIYTLNDTVYSYFDIEFGDEFSYTAATTNAVEQVQGIPTGKGLNLGGSRFSGFVNPQGVTNQAAGPFQHHPV